MSISQVTPSAMARSTMTDLINRADEAKRKMGKETNIANRAYWQGVFVGTSQAAKEVERLVNMIEAS